MAESGIGSVHKIFRVQPVERRHLKGPFDVMASSSTRVRFKRRGAFRNVSMAMPSFCNEVQLSQKAILLFLRSINKLTDLKISQPTFPSICNFSGMS